MSRLLTIALTVLLLAPFALSQDSRTESPDLLVVVDDHGLYGYIDPAGKLVIPARFLWADDFDRGYGEVFVCGRYVYVDRSGKIVAHHGNKGDELDLKKKGKLYGFVDAEDKIVILPQFEEALPFSEGLAAVKQHDKWEFINARGEFVIPPRFDQAYYFNGDVGQVESDGQSLLIDRAGNVLARGYSFAYGFMVDGRTPVERDDRFGYLDRTGRESIPPLKGSPSARVRSRASGRKKINSDL